ncbi:MAG: cyclic peptide export ABC transporter [Cyclobacteriaceae bacterium]|nr:cyclic peptide export ABC transporter [Cyclobacteriaceae bacterium SS2]
MRAILYLIKLGGWKFIGSGLLSLIAGFGSGYAIKIVNESIHSGINDLPRFLINLGISLFVFIVSSILASKAIIEILQNIIASLTKDFAIKILNSKFIRTEANQEKLMSVFFHDVNTISNLTEKIPNLFVSSTVVLVCSGYIFYLSHELFLMLIGLIVLVGFSVILTNKPLREIAKINRDIFDNYLQKTNHLIFGIRELKLNKEHRDYFIRKEYEDTIEKKKSFTIKERIIITITDKIVESVALASIAFMVLFFTYFTSNSNHESFVEGFTMTLFLAAPLASIASFAKGLKKFNAAINQISLLGLELGDHSIKELKTNTLNKLNSEIVLKSVGFQYPNKSDFTLKDLDLTIEPGSICFITGGNGSGKTTLAKVLSGLYTPSSGSIEFNNETLSENNLDLYRNLFSAIWNDNHTFEDINYNRWEDFGWKKILEDLELKSQVSIENGLYTNVKLSSGQLKRLAYLTLILEDKQVCLFDEWAANQDIEFKDYFYNTILSHLKSKGKTVIAITHDEKYFNKADKIYFLQEGKIKS